MLLFALSGVLATAGQTAPDGDLLAFRAKVSEAIKARDRSSLEAFFADGYTHTHAVGRVDDKPTRLAVLLSGEQTIDTVVPDSVTVRRFGRGLAVVQGRTTFTGEMRQVFQWTYVYLKRKGKWQIVLSQASPKIE